jgi:hypothetical protein
MLKQNSVLLLLATLAVQAQPVVSGMGRTPSEYTTAWGKAFRNSDGPFETKEQVWNVKRRSSFGSQEFEVHVLFRNGRSMEERWVRPGNENWEKAELWTVLDGKGVRFELLHQGTPLVSPYQVLQAPNTVINFLPNKGEMAAQLQNTLQGPQLRISSREWAQTKLDLGISGQQDAGRLASTMVQGRMRPVWGGKSLAALTSNLKEQPGKQQPNARVWSTRNGRGTVSITNGKKSTRLEVVVNDAYASNDANRALSATDPSPAPLKDALRESFRKFFATGNQAVPGMIGGTEWDPERVEGLFADEVLQDLLAMKQMPSEFSLLSWKDNGGETWDLSLLPTGYRLSISWPVGQEPK